MESEVRSAAEVAELCSKQEALLYTFFSAAYTTEHEAELTTGKATTLLLICNINKHIENEGPAHFTVETD